MTRQEHQNRFAEALRFFLDDSPDAENGIIIWVDHPLVRGKLVFEIEGKLSLEEAYAKMKRRQSGGSATESEQTF